MLNCRCKMREVFQKQYVIKQVVATIASGLLSVTAGFSFGFTAVLLPELEKDPSFPYDKNLASWIASITPLSMMIGSIFSGSLIDALGRKTGHIMLALISLVSWLILALATNNTLLLIGRFVSGLSGGSNRPISLVYLGEITDPKYRQFTLICTSISLALGVSICHILGGYISWRLCCYIYAGACSLCLIVLLYLKESPLWLISKGHTVEGALSFKWFRGQGIEAEKELELALQRQNEKPNRQMLKDIMNVSFVKPLITVFILSCVQFNGVNVFAFYAQELFDITFKRSIDSFILMIGLDTVRLVIVILVLACSKLIPRKIFFTISIFGCSVTLFVLAFYLYIEAFNSVSSVTIIVLYTGFSGAVNSLAWSFIPELFPANLRGLGSGIGAALLYFFLFICVKITPDFIMNYGEVAIYNTFGSITIIISIILCFVLPETNGRTLQDIESSYNENNCNMSSL